MAVPDPPSLNCGRNLEAWGPLNPDQTDFTLCFEYSALYGASASIALLVFAARINRLRSSHQPHNLGRTSWIYWPSQFFMLMVSIAMFIQAVNGYLSLDNSTVHAVSTSLMGSAWLLAMVVNYNEHKYTIRSSDSLFTFYIISILATAAILHTRYTLHYTHEPEYTTTIASLIFLILGFLTEAWPRGSTQVQLRSGAQAYEKANLFSQLTYHFFQPIVSLAARQQILHPSDVVNQLPETHRTKVGHGRLSASWNKAITKYQDKIRAVGHGPDANDKIKSIKKPSLMAAILTAYWKPLIPIMVMRIVLPLIEYLSPILLGALLDYIQDATGGTEAASQSPLFSSTEKPLIYGLAIAFSIFAVQVVSSVMFANNLRTMYLLSTEIKSALVAMIYRKSLILSPDSRRKSSKVYNNIGWSFLAGVIAILALMPLQLWRAGRVEVLEEERLKTTDERVRLTSEILSNAKIVKLYGWEFAFKNRILAARNVELKVLKRIGLLEAIMSVVFASSSVIIALVTFTVYVTIGKGDLTPKTVFVSITLFDMLHEPLSRLAEGTADTIGLIVATKRIQRFLLKEEIDETQIIREEYNDSDNENAIEIKDADLSWTSGNPIEGDEDEDEDEDEESGNSGLTGDDNANESDHTSDQQDRPFKPTLRSITLAVKDKTLTAVVGRVGQGKSSLLSAIVGEMYKLQGSIRVRGRIAYVPQQAWIFNATLRDNILFGNAYDPERYRQVLKVCGLETDLAILSAGDLTEIGERGINLSGGQKQRVSLARAAYDDADVYLLDDPLSAVDAHVDKHLWDNLIGPEGMLRNKTRVLVTHGIHHLEHVNQVVLIKDGLVAELGKYEDLMLAKQSFYQLIREYSAKHARRRRSSHAVTATAAAAPQAVTFGSSEIPLSEEPDDLLTEDASDVSEVDSSVTAEENPDLVLKRTASKNHLLEADDAEEEDELIAEEVLKKGGIEWRLIKTYVNACTVKLAVVIVLVNATTQACTLGTSLWLKHWISKTKEELQESLVLFFGVYFAVTVVYVVFYIVFVYLAMGVARIKASEVIHRQLVSAIVRLPMSFFDTTPLGRIINRFSSDMYSVDEHLPWKFIDMIYLSIAVSSTMVLIAVTTPSFVFMIPIIAVCYYLIQRYFIWATRSLKRINSASISPLYQHFDETLNGVSTIRAMAVQQRFIEENAKRTDHNANTFTASMYCNRWVDLRLQMVGSTIVLIVALSGVFGRYKIDPSLIGLTLNYALSLTDTILWLCRDFSEWQSHLVAIERVQEYTDKNTEAPDTTDKIIPEGWPNRGHVVFKDYSTRYREGLDLVIKHVSLEVQPGEKIGIVGRTGAGKSSLTLALFRIIEAANSYWARASDNSGYHITPEDGDSEHDPLLGGSSERLLRADEEIDGGSIEIDGIDISTLGLTDLRRHLAIIPQDPTLFAGTIRDNLDPFQELSDAELWEALERAHLKDHIRTLSGGLSAEVAQNGENFSVGQRSLICLARALLRKSKVLVLDEATAAVDVETDELIQRTIREEFRDRTVLTIAHRIKTVMDSSRIMVIEKGEVIEFEEPQVLLQRPESLFFKLAHQAGEVAT
ncbi:hypothetical protein BGX31_001878 [Mortierella sp. GBA43]|nr:hypothetical protein BGX31_001878 [Mortierella sp. GBA43]